MGKLGRNSQCYCGSNKKYKKCCLNKKHNLKDNDETILKDAIDLILQHDERFINQGVVKLEELNKKKSLSKKLKINVISSLSTGYRHQGYPQKSLDILKQLENISTSPEKDFPILFNQASNLFALGYIESSCSVHDHILKYCFKTKEQRNKDRRGLGIYLVEAGRAYHANRENEKAISCWEKSIGILENYDDDLEHLNRAKSNLAFYKLFNTDLENAESLVSEIEKISKKKLESGDTQGLANSYCNLAIYFWDRGRFERALAYMNKDLYLSRITGNKIDIITTIINLSSYYISLKQFKKAKDFLWQAEQICKEINSEYHKHRIDENNKIFKEAAKEAGISKTPMNEKAICLCDSGKLYVDCCGKADFEPVSLPYQFGGLSEDFKCYDDKKNTLSFVLRDNEVARKRIAWTRYEQHDGWGSFHEIPDMTNVHLMSAKALCKNTDSNSSNLANVLSSIILSVCSLEAFMNQVSYFLSLYKEQNKELVIPKLLSDDGPIQYQRKTSMEDKIHELSNCLISNNWLESSNSWKELKDLIYIRNELVHFKASGYEQVIPHPKDKHKIYEKIPSKVQISDKPHSWPFRICNVSMAEWGVNTVENFIYEFKSAFAKNQL